jgi:hypothetical protein
MCRKTIQIIFLLLLSVTLSACFGPKGKIRIQTNVDNAKLYIDGEEKASIGKNFIELELSAENHLFEVKGLSEDGEWRYYGSEELLIPENAIIEKKVYTESSETEKRILRKALEEKQREAKRLADKVTKEFQSRQTQAGGA